MDVVDVRLDVVVAGEALTVVVVERSGVGMGRLLEVVDVLVVVVDVVVAVEVEVVVVVTVNKSTICRLNWVTQCQ